MKNEWSNQRANGVGNSDSPGYNVYTVEECEDGGCSKKGSKKVRAIFFVCFGRMFFCWFDGQKVLKANGNFPNQSVSFFSVRLFKLNYMYQRTEEHQIETRK